MSGPFDLTGRLAVVTGANRGIGFGIATALADAGADIIAVSSRIPDSGSEIEAEVRARGREFRAVRCDLADADAVAALGAELRTSDVDILVNNAGTILRAPAAEHPMEWFERVLRINLTSQFALAQAVGGRMLERGRGKIVFTASLLSFQGGINVPGYAAAKSGLTGVVKALSNEWAGRGVNVNAIAPGYIATDNTQALRDDPERSRAILDRIPAGRWGEASDLGGAAVFLSSRASDYVDGVVLPVDGGWLGR
ncbi:SDR family oxidoreductase [Microbacterium sp. CIAB417]|uniref:SDR family oxidoreductase n=1 Tax=Microbacterium sp. CIAB417 TaxID=2860287 RepID=UPI001FAD0314|nr:SDR family oxidoreductase [Microbacterium sp. CIAB417]